MTDDTAPVTVALLAIERIADAGRLLALAAVEIEIGGIVFELRGVRVIRQAPMLVCEAPKYRRGAVWVPAVVLPPELRKAVADVVLDSYREGRA